MESKTDMFNKKKKKKMCLPKEIIPTESKKEKCKLHLQSQCLKGLSDYQRQAGDQEALQKEILCVQTSHKSKIQSNFSCDKHRQWN